VEYSNTTFSVAIILVTNLHAILLAVRLVGILLVAIRSQLSTRRHALAAIRAPPFTRHHPFAAIH
jgi:hypothetical protein